MKGLILAAALLGGDPIDELIERLGSDDPFERDRATEAIKKSGRRAIASLQALRTGDAEVAWRREAILEHLGALRESPLLLSLVQVGEASARILQADGSGFLLPGLFLEIQGEEEEGVWIRLLREGRGDRRATLHRWDRLAWLGVHDGWETYVCAQRDVTWRDGDFAILDDVLREEIARPFEIGAPPAFRLLTRWRGFSRLVLALDDRMKTTADPVVREACVHALETQRRTP